MRITALIPARGGSKGIPRKNLRILAGKPLLVHSIEHAMSAPEVDEVCVSTDDGEIGEIARAAGASVIERPAELSGDTATTESAVSHAIDALELQGKAPDIVVLLQATSPLRPSGAISDALATFNKGGYDSLLSLSPTHNFFWRIDNGIALAEYDYLNRPRRQDMKPSDIRYVENGSLYIFTREHFRRTGNRLGGKIGCVVFAEEYSVQIDQPLDFTVIEAIHDHL